MYKNGEANFVWIKALWVTVLDVHMNLPHAYQTIDSWRALVQQAYIALLNNCCATDVFFFFKLSHGAAELRPALNASGSGWFIRIANCGAPLNGLPSATSGCSHPAQAASLFLFGFLIQSGTAEPWVSLNAPGWLPSPSLPLPLGPHHPVLQDIGRCPSLSVAEGQGTK